MNKNEKSLTNMLFDSNNKESIVLVNENNEEVKFAQVAIIPLNKKIYAILKPIDKVENIAEDEAIVFRVEFDDEGEAMLAVEPDDKIAEKVFDEFNKEVDKINKTKQ